MSFDGHKHFFLLNLGMELMSHGIGKWLALRDASRPFPQRSCANLYPQQLLGFPGGSGVKNPPTNAGDTGNMSLIPGWGRVSGGEKWQPTPAFSPRKSHGQRNPVGYSPWGHKGSDTTVHLSTHAHRCPQEF